MDADLESTLTTGTSPLVSKVISLLLEEIDRCQDGGPLPPETDLATTYDVSRKTLRKAMERLVDQGIIHRIKRKGTFPTASRRTNALFRKQTARIGAVLYSGDFAADGVYAQVQAGAYRTALARGAQVLLAGGGSPREVSDTCFRLMDDRGIDGLLLIGLTDQQLIVDLAKWSKPICLIDHFSEAPQVDSMRVDSQAGSQLAVEHLFRLGHRRIGYLDNADPGINRARIEGYRTALRRWKLEQREEWELSAHADDAETIIGQLTALPETSRPTAILACSDDHAAALVAALEQFGLGVPEDISVVGTGGIQRHASTPAIDLTSVRFDWTHLGEIAIDALMDRLDGEARHGQELMVPPSLAVGTSTAPPP